MTRNAEPPCIYHVIDNMLPLLEYDKACIFYGKKCLQFIPWSSLLFEAWPIVAEIVCDILFVFEIHSITNLTLGLLSNMLK